MDETTVLLANDGTYDYIGIAPRGCSPDTASWKVIRVKSTEKKTAPVNSIWTNYLTLIYA